MKRYFMLILVFLAGIAAPINQFKLPPLMQQVMTDMNIGLTGSGWLMSVFALSGVLLALPSGKLLNRFGVYKVGIASVGLVLVGALMCAFSGAIPFVAAGRILEGAGTSLYSVAGPAAICILFRPHERGIPMGIWSTWVPVGAIFMYTAAPILNMYWDWRQIWLMAAVYAAVVFILFAVLFRVPTMDNSGTSVNTAKDKVDKKDIILLAAIFACSNTVTMAIKSYMPAFLVSVRNFNEIQASGATSIFLLLAMLTAPVSGIVSDRIGSRKKLIIVGAVFVTISVLTVFNVTGSMVSISLAVMGVGAGMLTTGVFTAVSELGSSATGMAAVVFGQYAGMCLGPVYFGVLAEALTWWTAGYMLLLVIAAMFVMIKLLKIR